MTKSIKIYIGILVLLFSTIVAVEFSRPKPINWTKTYNETQTIPYGTYIFYNELELLFPSSKVIDIPRTPYEFFANQYDWENEEYNVKGSYIYIDEEMQIDDVSAQELLDFAEYGNTVFISSSTFPETIQDSLHLEIDIKYSFTGAADFSLANPEFANDSIRFKRGFSNLYFSKVDSLSTTVLGYQEFNFTKEVNFIKVTHGSGQILLHLQPFAFTNYNLLTKDNQKYSSSVLAYLPDESLFFDSRNKKRDGLSASPLRFILSQPALKWAWLLSLVVLLVFIFFNAKRKQRIVKVVKPLENSTIDFTKTIGNLYFETKDHNNLITKKITYFLEHLRRSYYIDTQVFDDKFIKNLSLKSGRDIKQTKQLINLIAHLRAKPLCTENDLLNLNRAIENFHLDGSKSRNQ
jgi:hypothetical protein